MYLALLLPRMNIGRLTPATDIDKFASLDEHVTRRYDIDERRLCRVLVRQPHCNRDVI